MKAIIRMLTVFGLLAVIVAAGFAFATAQPVLANDVSAPVFQTTPEPPVDPPAGDPPAQPTVIIPDTGDTIIQDDDDAAGFDSWWLLVLFGVLLVGLIIGLLMRGSHTHHVD